MPRSSGSGRNEAGCDPWPTWCQSSIKRGSGPRTNARTDTPGRSIHAPRLSIVVLPFANLNRDPDQDYFVDGLTEDLTTELSRLAGSFVIAWNTAFSLKKQTVD